MGSYPTTERRTDFDSPIAFAGKPTVALLDFYN